MIAVSFALGVVEPEASGIGGDGVAVLYLKGMKQPTVIDYKDQTPIRATPDNPAIMADGRLVADGPAAANIPGVVAGLDYLYRKYGSGKVKWAELIEPAIRLAEKASCSTKRCRRASRRAAVSSRSIPRRRRSTCPAARCRGRAIGSSTRTTRNTLRAIAKDGGETFYRGEIARKIAADLEENGGIIGYAGSGAVPRDRARAGRRAVSRSHASMPAARRSRPAFSCSSRCRCSRTISRGRARAPTTDADYFHYVLEAWKVRDPVRRVADPERWPVDFAEHLTAAHAQKLFEKIDPQKASRYERQLPRRRAGSARRRASAPARRRLPSPTRRQHDRRDADAQHVGRHVLRVEGARLSLQQPPAIVAHHAGRVRQPGAADAIEHGERADAGVREDAGRRSARGWRWARRQRLDSASRSTTSSPA